MLIVQKYGGSSVGSLERIRSCAQRVLATQRAGPRGRRRRLGDGRGDQPADRSRQPARRARATRGGRRSQRRGAPTSPANAPVTATTSASSTSSVCTGENVSAALLAMAIQNAGGSAISLVGPQIGMRTDGTHTNARITGIEHARAAPGAGHRAGGRVRRLPGHRARRQHHDARARRLGHLGGRAGRGAEGRRLRDLDRRRRGLHHRPARRAARAQDPADHLRGDARAGQPRRQGAADPQRRVRHEVRRAGARALEPQRQRRDVDHVGAAQPRVRRS
jgi:hypothetical protein